MNAEEYHYLNRFAENTNVDDLHDRLVENIDKLEWVLKNFRAGKIRKTELHSTIPLSSLETLLKEMIRLEKYEICAIIHSLMVEAYDC